MRLLSALTITSVFFAATTIPGMAMPRAHRGPTSPKLFNKRSAPPKPAPRVAGPRVIESARSAQIQGALIRSGYLTGPATGVWDAQTETAMQKMQAENGWQTKIVPDARAIIKLGLGPNSATPAVSEPELVDTP